MVRSISSVSEIFGASYDDWSSPVARPTNRVFIISDDELHRGVLRADACNDGFDTCVAPDATRAIETHQTDWTPDAIVVDQLMPRTDGGVQRDLDPRIIDVHVVRLMVKFGPTSQMRIDRTADRDRYLLRTSA